MADIPPYGNSNGERATSSCGSSSPPQDFTRWSRAEHASFRRAFLSVPVDALDRWEVIAALIRTKSPAQAFDYYTSLLQEQYNLRLQQRIQAQQLQQMQAPVSSEESSVVPPDPAEKKKKTKKRRRKL